MLKTILIFGGSGFVGSNIAFQSKKMGFNVYVANRTHKEKLSDFNFLSCDITNLESIAPLINRIMPDIVVNTAAIADIDFAEKEKEITRRINFESGVAIAKACSVHQIKYIFLSSDAVFDGNKSEYFETDIPSPVNYYGQTKALAEKGIIEAYPQSVIVRISLVLGLPLDGGNSFVSDLKNKLQSGTEIYAPTDIVRTPVDVKTLSSAVIELGLSDFSGIIHIGGLEKINRYDLTRRLAKALGFEENKILPANSGERDSNKARRHKNGCLNVQKAVDMLKTKMLNMDSVIRNAVD
jgi:dTDP-4-dehydrorhamnose reductase